MPPALFFFLRMALAILSLSSIQSLSRIWLFATSWTAACQVSLSITNSWSLLKLMSIKLMRPFNQLILCCPRILLPSIFPSVRVFSNESVFASGGQSIGTSISASVLPMNIQDWFPLGLTGLISLKFKGQNIVLTFFNIFLHRKVIFRFIHVVACSSSNSFYWL